MSKEIKFINLHYARKDFLQLQAVKDKREKTTNEKISWEDFIFVEIVRRKENKKEELIR